MRDWDRLACESGASDCFGQGSRGRLLKDADVLPERALLENVRPDRRRL